MNFVLFFWRCMNSMNILQFKDDDDDKAKEQKQFLREKVKKKEINKANRTLCIDSMPIFLKNRKHGMESPTRSK